MVNHEFKLRLHAYCIALLEQRIAGNKLAMEDAQQSANSEEKSSAGDKYETGRAMSQIQRDMSAKQMKTAMDELAELKKINTDQTYSKAIKGALIKTSSSLIYMAAGLGMIEFESEKVAIISLTSPLATELAGKIAGSTFAIAGKQQQVITII